MKVTIFLIVIAVLNIKYFSSVLNLDNELHRLKSNTALLIVSQAIDEYPVWSQDSDYVGCNIMGKWVKVDLKNIKLEPAIWNKINIGVLKDRSFITPSGAKMFLKQVS